MSDQPLILITNDDGIASPGLRAAAAAALPLGEVLVVAPRHQQTGAGRSLRATNAPFEPYPIRLPDGQELTGYTLDTSPAQVVRRALLLLTPRPPALVISGINYGENVGVGVTISGTVGAAIEAATFGIRALAMSLETDIEHHISHDESVDFTVAAQFTRYFAQALLTLPLPQHTDLLKVDVPRDATIETPWRITRISRQAYFHSTVIEEANERRITGYGRKIDPDTLERDSDIYALMNDRVVSVSPMTIDLTAWSDRAELAQTLKETLPPTLINIPPNQ